MSNTSVTPSIGRKVWFWMSQDALEQTDSEVLDPRQAFDATVVFVGKDAVNLYVMDHDGEGGLVENVPCKEYVEGLTAHGGEEDFYTWMPYQKQQAAFAAAKEEEAGK
jgi:hypothetical protein